MDRTRVGTGIARAESAQPVVIAGSGLAIVAALVLGVGLPGHMVLRHIVQTLPLWPAIILGLRRSRAAGWASLPLFLFWFVLMSLIWLHLLGIWHAITGNFSTLETAMTVIVGVACLVGMAGFVPLRSSLRPWTAALLFIGLGIVQIACMRVSFLPEIAHR
jgi:hypothetical protein